MKYSIIVLSVLISLLSTAQTITVTGKITNPKGAKFSVSYKEDGASKSVDLNEDGSFYMKINEAREGYYTYWHRESQTLYLEPGDSIYITLDALNFDETANYTGTGAEKCNFLKKKYMIYEYSKSDNFYMYEELAKLKPEQIAEKILAVQTLLFSMLDEIQAEDEYISESFFKSEKDQIKILTVYNLRQLEFVYQDYNKAMLESYTDYFKQKYLYPNIVLDTTYFKDYEYKDIIIKYISDLAMEAYRTDSLYYKNESYGYPAAAIQTIVKNINFSDDFKDYCLYYFVKNYVDGYYSREPIMCFTGYYTLEGHQELYNDFNKYCKNEKLKNRIKKSLEKYAAYFEYFEKNDSTALGNWRVERWLFAGYIDAYASRLIPNYYAGVPVTKARFLVINDIKSDILRNFLLYHYMVGYLKLKKSEYDESTVELFRKYCSSKEYNKKIDELLLAARKLSEGDKAPDFTVSDIEGKEYGLKDFRGKYIYIDVWATWCGPCKKEIPFLEKLYEEYKGKNITFMSISVDKNLESWKRMVKEGNMKGFQLRAEDAFESELCKRYMISAIPRFLIIDPEGKIVSTDAERPSGKIREVLDKLNL